ncbi:MAG: ABC transporter permease [Spirochaetota bacterium]
MKCLAVFRKSLKEQTRDLLMLVLSLVFAPFFVFLYWLFFPSGSTTYDVLVLNNNISVQTTEGTALPAGDQAVAALEGVTYANGNPLLNVRPVNDRAEAETRLRNRDAAVLVIIPADFSRAIQAARERHQPISTSVILVGDLTNPYYTVTAVMVMSTLDQYIQNTTGETRAVQFIEQPLGASGARSEFETYVPGLLVFAVVMLVFLAAMTVTREVEAGTLRRLHITRMTSLDLLGGVSASLILIGVAQVVLTFLTAWVLGFRSQGPLWVAILVGIVTSFSIIGAGLVVACFSKTVTQAFLAASFPMVLFMFFSGAIYPVPKVPLFNLAGRTINLYDILPPTHAVVALNKVLTLGVGIKAVAYELTALLILSVMYFAVGVWLFKRTHLRAL